MSAQLKVTSLSGNTSNHIDFGNLRVPNFEAIHEVQYVLPEGWSFFSIPLKLDSIVYGHSELFNSSNQNPAYNPYALVAPNGNYPLDDFMKNHWYEFANDTVPYWYKDNAGYLENMIILKNYLGDAYLPNFNFNGIGNIAQLQGLHIKTGKSGTCLKYSGVRLFDAVANAYDISYDLPNGWILICYPNIDEINAEEFFAPFVENNNLIIAKDTQGHAYLPQWNFNGIGSLKPYRGYQIKLQNME